MTLDIKRIREMFWLFGMILPMEGASNKEAIKATLGHGLEEIIPDVMILLSQYCERNPEEFESYMQFMIEALAYMRDERENHPAIEGTTFEDYKDSMLIQLGRYTKAEKRKTDEKYSKLQEKAPQVAPEEGQ